MRDRPLDYSLHERPPTLFSEAFKVWFKIGCLSFGGPAGQIALMHRIVVDEKKWLPEARFLHALNFSMLLPGPEATATRHLCRLAAAWRARRARRRHLVRAARRDRHGGLEPALRYGRGLPAVDGALFGIKAAVLVIVVEALIRIGKRALKSSLLVSLAALAFIAIFFFALPFPLIVAGAALIGYRGGTQRSPNAWASRSRPRTTVPEDRRALAAGRRQQRWSAW